MDKSESRRRFLQDMTALGAAGSVFAASTAQADGPHRMAQAQGSAPAPQTRASENTSARGLPRELGPGPHVLLPVLALVVLEGRQRLVDPQARGEQRHRPIVARLGLS